MTEADLDNARLRGENQRLSEELCQAKSDKEFVWSLWKRLQVASPDLTQAISMVVQREKEKAETKDAKVLQILQLKDAKIEDMQQVVTKQSRELSLAIQKKADLIDQNKKLEAEVVSSAEEAKKLASQLRGFNSTAEERRRGMIEEYERQTRELSEKVTNLQVELTRLKSEDGDLRAANIALQSRSDIAERELARLRGEAGSCREEAVRGLARAEAERERLQVQLQDRQEEMARLRERLEAAQADLQSEVAMRSQLQVRESSQEQLHRSREKVHSRNAEELSRQIAALAAENRALRLRPPAGPKRTTNLAAPDSEAEEEQCERALRGRRGSGDGDEPVVDLGYRMERLQRQVRLLEGNLSRREAVIRSLKDAAGPGKALARAPGPYVRQNRTTRLRARSAPLRVPRRCLQSDSLQRQLSAAERRSSDLENEVAARDEEICALKLELDQRARRLQQLRMELRRHRSTAAELSHQQEASDRHHREEEAEVEALLVELRRLRDAFSDVTAAKCSLEEEVARLRQERLQDESAILELKHRVKHDGDAIKVDSREKERLSQELEQLRLQLRASAEQRSLDERQTNNSMGMAQRAWEAERRGLCEELQALAEELSGKKVELAALGRELRRLREAPKGSDNGAGAMAGILEHFAAAEEAARAEETPDKSESEAASSPRDLSSARRSQSGVLRRRLTALQNQLRSVRKSRSQLASSLTSMQQRNRHLTRELEAATARCQRLRGATSGRANFNNNAQNSETEEEPRTPRRKREEEQEAALELRARAEVQRLSVALREVREEAAEKEGRVTEMRERLAKSDRDLGQKRTLIEELRTKLKATQEGSKSEKEAAENAAQRIRELAEGSERQRVQLESLKRRLAAVTAERKRHEAEAVTLRAELERKSKVASEATSRRAELEKRLSCLEKAHEEKLNTVVRRSEAGVNGARAKVAEVQARAMRAQRLLLRVCRGLNRRAGQARELAEVGAGRRRRLRESEDTRDAESMRAARERAADILNLSLEDVDDILHPESSPARRAEANLADEEWEHRCERILKEGDALTDSGADSLWRQVDAKLSQLLSTVQAAVGVAQA